MGNQNLREKKLLCSIRNRSLLPLSALPVVYGPREENFFTFIKLIQKGWGLQIGRAGKELSLIYVSDLV